MIELNVTDGAKAKVLDFMKGQNKEGLVIRVTIPNTTAQGFNYQFFLDEEKNIHQSDVVVQCDSFKIVVDDLSAKNLDGATIDWADGVEGSGFKVDNPNKPQVNFDLPPKERIEELFEQEINPMLASHGGQVELIEVNGPRAYVKMSGGCQGCASSAATLKQGIEVRIKDVAPEILEVIDSTDHAAGTNPYYSGAPE